MVAFNWMPLGFGALMASIDVFMLSLIRTVSKDKVRLIRWMIAPTILYAIQPWIFLASMKYETMIVMNLLWDVTSDVMVTLVGLFYFGETVGPFKKIGIVLSFLSMILLSLDDGFSFFEFLGI